MDVIFRYHLFANVDFVGLSVIERSKSVRKNDGWRGLSERWCAYRIWILEDSDILTQSMHGRVGGLMYLPGEGGKLEWRFGWGSLGPAFLYWGDHLRERGLFFLPFFWCLVFGVCGWIIGKSGE